MKKEIISFSIIIVVLFIVLLVFATKNYLLVKFAFYPDNENIIDLKLSFVTDHFIKTDDGLKIHGYLFQHTPKADKVVLYFHGNAGNSSHRISEVLNIFKENVDVLLIDYRGYGKSEGKISEVGLYKDADASYNYLLQQNYSTSNIYILGRSIGSVAAVNVAQNKKVGGVILVTPLSSAKDMADIMGFKLISFMVKNNLNNFGKIQNIVSKMLFIHGNNDQVIPHQFSKNLYNSFNGNKRYLLMDGAGHNNISQIDSEKYWNEILRFIEK